MDRAGLWRIVALICIGAAAAFVAYNTLQPALPDYGMQTTNVTRRVRNDRVLSVTPNSPAARAGIKAGDTVSFGRTPYERTVNYLQTPGTPVSVVVNGARRAILVAPSQPFASELIGAFLVRLAFLAVAALLAWRRPDDPAARSLVLFLLCYGLLIGLQNTLMPSPVLSMFVQQTASTSLLLIGIAAAATFAAQFPSGIAQPVPRLLARVAQVLAAAGVALALVATFLFMDSENAVLVAYQAISWIFIVASALVVAILVVAYIAGAPSERQRRRWVFLMLGIGLAAVAIDIVVQATLGYSGAVDAAAGLFIGAVPFGLAYAILRYRVLDVGFVVNRALVYRAVSAIVVGIFVVVEALASQFIEQHSRAGSIAVQLAVALGLGFSIRAIHARVDRAVDRVLFRQRHLDEAAIEDFMHDAHYVTSADALIERCVSIAIRNGHATSAAVWLREPDGGYAAWESPAAGEAAVSENDPALVAMRARRIVAELHGLESRLPGALAFPMIVRGELLGALVCGNKEQGESYAPDEIASLRGMATAVGHGLDALRIRDLEERLRRLEA